MKPPKILILGYGAFGTSFVRLYHARYEIRGVKRSPLPDQPCPIVLMPIQSEALRSQLEWADVVLFSPSSGRGDLALYRETYIENMQYLLKTIRTHNISIASIVLVGSTGAYPRSQDKCWEEDDAIPKESDRQKILLETEVALAASRLPYTILRCGGLYGTKRGHFYRYFREGKIHRSKMSNQAVLTLHFDDLSRVVTGLIEKKITGEIFNVVDDTQLTRSELAEWIAKRWHIPIVEDGAAPPVPDRQISNRKLKAVLKFSFHHPTLQSFLSGHPELPLSAEKRN